MKKKKLFLPLAILAGLSLAGCGSKQEKPAMGHAVEADTVAAPAGGSALYAFLEENIGKYPRDVELLENQDFEERVERLVGEENCAFVATYMQTQTPIAYGKDFGHPDLIMFQAFEAHNAGVNDVMFAYNPKTDNLMVRIVKNGKQPLLFQEKQEPWPF